LEGADTAVRLKYMGLFDQMGLGKSVQSLMAVIKTKKRALVIMPSYLTDTWKCEIASKTNLVCSIFSNKHKYDMNAEIVLLKYSMITYAEELFKTREFIICDEIHYIKSLQTIRTKTLHGLMLKYIPEYFMGLSGTPIKNRIPEAHSFLLLLALSPTTTKKITTKYRNHYVFCCRFTNLVQQRLGYRTITKYQGMKNIEELREYILPYILRRTASVVDLPDLIENNIVVDYKEDKALEKVWEQYQESPTVNITAKMESAVAKAMFTSEYVKDLVYSEEGPVVVFSDHLQPLEVMARECSDLRVKVINGSVSSDLRVEYIRQFQNGALDVLLCSIGSASTGFTMTAAKHLVFNDSSWVSTDMEQAKKRIHRIGQKEKCFIHYIVGSKIDEYIINAIRNKAKVVEKLLEQKG
jgi:SWI/SNF-related matrix-associated actin-dependent regulator of chromatin subfamily A-like protein 1